MNELARPIKLRPLPGETIVIEADAGERTALAERFALASVDALRAEIALTPDGKAVRASGTLRAQFMQICAISAEEFPVSVDEPLTLRFVDEADMIADEEDPEIEIELSDDDCDEILFSGDVFDLGEAVAQSLGLAIDPYAEGPEADAARKTAGIISEEDAAAQGPLAEALAGLKKD